MATSRKKTTKAGREYYEISVSRGRQAPKVTTRWYTPPGWSQKSIDRELAKVAAEFERQVKAGEITSLKERKAQAQEAALEERKIKTLRQYVQQVFLPCKGHTITENTRASYEGNFTTWIFPALGDFKLPEITPPQITALLVGMQSQGKAHASVVKVYSLLQGVFKMAYQEEAIPRNPMDRIERPKARKDEIRPEEPQAYTPEEAASILAHLENEPLKWRCYIRLLLETGLRRGECCGLQWKDIDFAACEITINHSLGYTPQKGIYLGSTKNGKSRVVYPSCETWPSCAGCGWSNPPGPFRLMYFPRMEGRSQ